MPWRTSTRCRSAVAQVERRQVDAGLADPELVLRAQLTDRLRVPGPVADTAAHLHARDRGDRRQQDEDDAGHDEPASPPDERAPTSSPPPTTASAAAITTRAGTSESVAAFQPTSRPTTISATHSVTRPRIDRSLGGAGGAGGGGGGAV